MNDSWSWAPTSKHYEHFKAMDDKNDSWSCAQGSRWYEQLKSMVDLNYSRSWAKGSSVRIEPLKAWHDVINLEFIIYLMMFQFHYYPSLFHVLYSMSILASTFLHCTWVRCISIKLLHCIVSHPWENIKLVLKLVVALTYGWDRKLIIYSLWIRSLLMETGSNRYSQ